MNNNTIQELSDLLCHNPTQQFISDNLQIIQPHLLIDIINHIIQVNNNPMVAIIILQLLVNSNRNSDIVIKVIDQKLIQWLQSSDHKLSELTVRLIQSALSQLTLPKTLVEQVIEKLLEILVMDGEFKGFPLVQRLAKAIFQQPMTDGINRIKVIEPLFYSRYMYTNRQDQMVQGLLHGLNCFLQHTNKYCGEWVTEVIEIMVRCCLHSNKYVRIAAVQFAISLSPYQNTQQWKLIINNTLHSALIDESIEVRVEALKYFDRNIPLEITIFVVPLLVNSHLENMMESAANLCNKLFPAIQPCPPILGIIQYIADKLLEPCLQYCYEQSLSRYYQIRCSGLSTLQSLILFLKTKPNALPYLDIFRITQNCTYMEIDPQVRQSGFGLMHHLIRLNYASLTTVLPLALENCMFHLSDIPEFIKDNCAKVISILYSQIPEQVMAEIKAKFELLKCREQLFLDFIGPDTVNEVQQHKIDQAIAAQGGRDKVINKHYVQIVFGLSLCFRYIAQITQSNITDKVVDDLKFIITLLSENLRHQLIYNDSEGYKPLIYAAIVNGLCELKNVKRLPIKLLDETELIKLLNEENQVRLIEQLGTLVGATILKGRM